MARFNKIQNSFASGQLSKELRGRTEIKEYATGAEIIRNFIIKRHGGASKRDGFVYGRSVHKANSEEYSMFSFRPGGKNLLVVIKPFNTSGGLGITDAPIDVYSIEANNYLNPLVVSYPSAVNFSYISYGFYETNLKISSGQWNVVQYGVNMIITHTSGEVAPIIISYKKVSGVETIYVNHFSPVGYSGASTIEIPNDPGNILASGLRMPFQVPNGDTAKTLSIPTATVGAVGIVTASSALFEPYIHTLTTGKYNIRPFYIHMEKSTGEFVYMCVYNYISPTQCNYIVLNSSGTWVSPTALASWRISAWGGNLGYPKTAVVYQERLIFGGSPAFPDTIWASYAGNFFLFDSRRINNAVDLSSQPKFFNYKGERIPSDPFDFAIASEEISVIAWMTTGMDVRVGTAKSEYAVGNVDSFFSDTNSYVRKVTGIGGADIPATNSDNSTMFISRDRKRLYSFEEGGSNYGYTAKNITLLSSDIITARLEESSANIGAENYSAIVINKICWSRSRSILWMHTSNNDLIGLTYSSDAGTLAWHRHDFGSTGFKILDICSVPGQFGTEDDLWMLIQGATGGVSLYSMSGFSGHIDMANISTYEADKPIFVDSAMSFGADNGSLVSASTSDFSITDDTLKISRNDYNRIHIGHPIKFVAPTLQASLPVGLVLDTTYYAVPINYSVNSALPTAEGFNGRTSIKFSTTLANAQANVFINITAAPSSGLVTMDSRIDVSSPEYFKWPANTLQGATLSVIIDGVYIGDYLIGSDKILNLVDKSVNKSIIYGIKYDSVITTMNIDAGSQLGSSLESIERIDRVMVILTKSKDGVVGGIEGIFDDIIYDFTDSPTMLETINETILLPDGPRQETKVTIKSSKPLPLTVEGIVMRGTQHD